MPTNHFDVFLSYHWRDHAHVEALARQLREHNLTVFLDRWYLTPGQSWPKELEATLARCRAVAVCIGQGEMGPWQQREQYLALERQVAAERQGQTFPVIPVLLPGAEPPLGFLSQHTCVDFRARVDDPVLQHHWSAPFMGSRQDQMPWKRSGRLWRPSVPIAACSISERKMRRFSLGVKRRSRSSPVRCSSTIWWRWWGRQAVANHRSGERVWEVVTLVPTDRPVHALAAILLPLLEPDMTETDRLLELNKLTEALLSQSIKLREVVDRVLAKQPGIDRLLLIADQWEELFTLCKDDKARRCFIDNILEATAATKLSAVLTLRGDFFGRAITDYRPLSNRVQGAQVNLVPMKREELRLAIEEPAKKVKLTFQAGLVDLMLGQAGDEPGKLPLLEFVLRRLWEDRRGGELHHEAYTAMGQLEGAIAHKAESVFVKLSIRMYRTGTGSTPTPGTATLVSVSLRTSPNPLRFVFASD